MLKICRGCNKTGNAHICATCEASSLKVQRHATNYGTEHQKLRRQCLERAGHRCQVCGARATHADHAVALARGGTRTLANLVALCAECNEMKLAKSIEALVKYRLRNNKYVLPAVAKKIDLFF